MAVIVRLLPLLVIAYAVVTIALFWVHQRTRLYPLYVLKVLWVSCTILAFAWVVTMSGGQNKEYIQNPSGPLEVLVGKMQINAAGQNELSGGYPQELRRFFHLSPVGALAILAGTWITWGILRGRREKFLQPGRPHRLSRRQYWWWGLAICVAMTAGLVVVVLGARGSAEALYVLAVLAVWLIVIAAVGERFLSFGGWAVLALLIVFLTPLIPPVLGFEWSRYRFFSENYRTAWVEGHVGRYFINSLMVTVTTVAVTTLVGAMAAYIIARQHLAGRGLIYALVIGGITIPGILIQVPLFLLVKDWGFAVGSGRYSFMDSRLGLATIYTGISLPFTIFVMTGFFRTLPGELAEAACIDGCSRWRTFRGIYLPLALPGLATTGIFNFLGAWNEFNLGMIFMSNPNYKTLPIGLYELQIATQFSSAWAPLFAGIVLLCLPTFLIFVFLQERIVAGLTTGASKG